MLRRGTAPQTEEESTSPTLEHGRSEQQLKETHARWENLFHTDLSLLFLGFVLHGRLADMFPPETSFKITAHCV